MNKETIKEIVENYFELSISRNTRKRQYVEARAIYFKLCREFTQLSRTNRQISKQRPRICTARCKKYKHLGTG